MTEIYQKAVGEASIFLPKQESICRPRLERIIFSSFGLEVNPQISAKLTAPDSDSNYFWYMLFESAAFGWSEAALQSAFWDTIEKILAHETRIIQKNGWVNWHFKCEWLRSTR